MRLQFALHCIRNCSSGHREMVILSLLVATAWHDSIRFSSSLSFVMCTTSLAIAGFNKKLSSARGFYKLPVLICSFCS